MVSGRADGDFHLDHVTPDVLEVRRRRLVDAPWTLLDERHGTAVVEVGEPGDGDRQPGDVAVTAVHRAVLGVWAGDCAAVVLVTPGGTLAVVHAGWRGLAAGVLGVAIDAIVADGDGGEPARPAIAGFLGPCIRPCCYEFGGDELTAVAERLGLDRRAVAGVTSAGGEALDVPAAVRAVLERRGVVLAEDGRCTGCDPQLFSHRVRGELGRHVVAAWKDRR